MTKPPIKKPARRVVKAKPAPKPAPKRQRTPAERKAKAIELLLEAVSGGWSIRRFSRRSGVSIRSLLRWVQEPTVHPRYIAAMQTKAMLMPDEAMEMVKVLRDGGELMLRPDPDSPSELRWEFVPVNVKAMGVALRHYEYRMMREIKVLYAPSRQVEHSIADAQSLPDEKIDARFNELMGKALGGLPPALREALAAEMQKSGE